MDAKIVTGFLLWFCLIASLSISQVRRRSLECMKARTRRFLPCRAPRPASTQGKGSDDKTMKVSDGAVVQVLLIICLQFVRLCACLCVSSTSSLLSSFVRFHAASTCFLLPIGVACPEGTKACKDDNKTCATYCDSNPECADGSDEIDCGKSTMPFDRSSISSPFFIRCPPTATDASVTTASNASVAIASNVSAILVSNASITVAPIAIVLNESAASTESSAQEIERADIVSATTDALEATLPRIITLDPETVVTGVTSIAVMHACLPVL